MSRTSSSPTPDSGRRRPFALRILAWSLIALLAFPPPARAQLLPIGPALGQLLGPINQLVGALPILGPLLQPLLPALLAPLTGLLGPILPNEHKLDSALKNWSRVQSSPPQRVIVTVRPGLLGLIGWILGLLDALLPLDLSGINALLANVTRPLLGVLLINPLVERVSLDAPLRPVDGNLVVPRDGAADTDDTLRDTLGLGPTGPLAIDGRNVGVAVVDSGIAPLPDFAGRITAFYDFTRGGRATVPLDPYGHGTHVAGIIAGNGISSAGGRYRGVGPRVRLIGLRVLNDQGVGPTSRVIEAIEFAIKNRYRLGIDIINLSLGHPVYESAATDPLVRVVERAVGAGIVVVTSAGNFGYNRDLGQTGYGGITSPGNAPSAITVGALRSLGTVSRDDDQLAPYSSRGPSWIDALAKPDLLAPGDRIVSTVASSSALYQTYPLVRAGYSHMRLNGTSMASAAATGVVALMQDVHRRAYPFGRSLTPNAVKAILQYTATPLGVAASPTGTPDALTQGAGALNARGALAAAAAIDANRPVGTDWMSRVLDERSTYDDTPIAWTRVVTWRDTQVFGSLLERHRRAWGKAVPWGRSVYWEPDVSLGGNVVWDRPNDWASEIVWGTQMVGTPDSANGQTFVWGYVEDPERTHWGDLADRPTDGQTFVWGYHEDSISNASSTTTRGSRP